MESISFTVYPNPVNDILNIGYSLAEKDIASLRIYNLEGKEMKNLQLSQWATGVSIDLSNFSKGTYLYVYHVNGVIEKTGKLIKL